MKKLPFYFLEFIATTKNIGLDSFCSQRISLPGELELKTWLQAVTDSLEEFNWRKAEKERIDEY